MKTVAVLSLVFLAMVLVLVMPFLSIWSLNTLFPQLSIPINFNTWCAAFFLNSMIFYRGIGSK